MLDLGCGNGAQTIQLAKYADGTILAVDNHQPYLDELQRRAEAEGVFEKIRPYLKDMHHVGPDDGPFDLIWSEGALYFMGFRDGLVACHALLAPGGSLGFTELSWLRSDPPAECRQYFSNEYPVMVDIETNSAVIKACGFEILGHFTLPESAWLDRFYQPLEDRLPSLRVKYADHPEKIELIESVQMEIDFYRTYSGYYGYEFYLVQRA